MTDINFSNLRIIVQDGYNNRHLIADDLKPLQELSNFKSEYKSLVYDIFVSVIDDEYLWLYAKYGNPNPCPNQVLDKQNYQYKQNTRTANLVEMRHQFFMLLNIRNNILYLSNINKRAFLENILREKLNIGISINTIFVDLSEFDSKIKELKTIKFTSYDNLFTQHSKLNDAFKDMLGYGANIDFKIEINCENKPLDKGYIIKNLKNRLDNQEVRDLVIIGENDDQFEQIFNAGTFNKKISISISENEENLFDENEVLNALLGKIKDV